ncbi:MAG: hypothetical protein OEW15_04855 [Nitrospirota bacterium]|nr:hypothetical protein [Nitrospirota bacterium]
MIRIDDHKFQQKLRQISGCRFVPMSPGSVFFIDLSEGEHTNEFAAQVSKEEQSELDEIVRNIASVSPKR